MRKHRSGRLAGNLKNLGLKKKKNKNKGFEITKPQNRFIKVKQTQRLTFLLSLRSADKAEVRRSVAVKSRR